MKGFFNAIEAFRADRDSDGWRVKNGMKPPSVPQDGSLSDHHELTPEQEAMETDEGKEIELSDSGT